MFCCTLLYVHSSIAIILMGKRELVALLNLSSWCLVMIERLFLAVPWGCLRFVIVVVPDHTHLLFLLTVPRRCFFCGSFLLVMLHVGMCCNDWSVFCSLVITRLERADLLAVVCVVFCHFPKCVMDHIRIKGEVGAIKLVKAPPPPPPVKYFTDRSKAVLLLWIFYVFSVLCLLCLCERLFICGHLLGKG